MGKETPQEKENPLGSAPLKSILWKFAIPGIISSLVNAMHNIVDQVFVGWGIGELGIAATNIAFPLATMTTAMVTLLGMGGAVRFSLELGANNREAAAKTMGNSLAMMVLVGVSLAALALLFLNPLLYAFGATDTIMPYAMPYALIISIGLPLGIFGGGAAFFIRADGNPNYSSFVLLSGAVFNIVFDPIFLFVFKMGIAGIALATVLGQLLTALLALHYLLRKLQGVKLKRSDLVPGGRLVLSICGLGAASCFTHIAGTAVQIVQSNSLRYYGAFSIYGSDICLAAAGAVSKVMMVLLSCVIGISLGCQPIYGYNYGKGQFGRVRETFLLALRYGTTIAVCAFLAMQIFPRQILTIFGAESELFYEFAVRYMRIFLFMTFVNAVQPIASMFFTSMGKAKLGLWMALIRQVLLLIPLLLILPYFFGIEGLFFAGPLADGVSALVALLFARRELRRLRTLEAAQGKRMQE